jgi:flagellar protein FlgJ
LKIGETTYLKQMQTLNDTLKPELPDRADKDFNSILKTAIESEDQKRLYQACQDMEGVFLTKVFQSMRQTISRSDLMGSSFAMDTFESMLYDQYALMASQTKALGIADLIYQQLNEQLSTTSPFQSSVDDKPSPRRA